ncbi:hypothetical protein AB0N05_11900 [Nocardia sp. NPDC051030]
MEIFVILALVIVVGVVLLLRRRSAHGSADTDLNTGNPPSSNDDVI